MAQYAFKASNVGDGDRILPTEWFDINNKGERIGTCWAQPIRAVYHKGTGSTIRTFTYGNRETNAHGLNDQGMIVGRNVQTSPLRAEGFSIPSIEQIDTPTFISAPDGPLGTELFAVNKNQEIVGLYGYAPPGGGLTLIQMFIHHAGHYTRLGEPSTEYSHPMGINDHGHIVGGRTENGKRRAFIYQNGSFSYFDFPSAENTSAYDINNHGHVVGWYTKENSTHGFLFADEHFSTIDYPDADSTYVHGINDSGMIVGSYRRKNWIPEPSGFVAVPTTAAVEPQIELLQIEKHLDL
ncbi:MAG: hypothetical protein ACRECO_08805 [Xanthobacteraceae bacterium]